MKKRDLKTCYSTRQVKEKALPVFVRHNSMPAVGKGPLQTIDFDLLLCTAHTLLSPPPFHITPSIAKRKARLRRKELSYWRSALCAPAVCQQVARA